MLALLEEVVVGMQENRTINLEGKNLIPEPDVIKRKLFLLE